MLIVMLKNTSENTLLLLLLKGGGAREDWPGSILTGTLCRPLFRLITTFTAFLFIQYFNVLGPLAVFSKSSGLL